MATHEPGRAGPAGGPELGNLGQVSVEVVAVLGRAKLPVQRLLELRPGAVVALERYLGEPVDLEVGGVLVARGEVVVLDGRYAVRITELVAEDG